MLTIASVMLHSGTVLAADGFTRDPSDTDDAGFTILSNATNVTHWGLGAGVGFEQSPYKGYGSKVTPIPLIFFDDKWVHALGTTLDLKLGKWSSLLFTLRGQYALGDGYKGSDAPILNGMQTRKGAFWLGPAFAWHTEYGTLSGDILTGENKGQKANIEFAKALDFGKFSVEPHVGAEWLSSKDVDYYYGVRSSEVKAGRPAYTGRAAYNLSIGTKVDYKIARQQLVFLDVGVSHLTSGITDSPLVGKRYIPEVRLGYLYQFK
ncbi:MipA/OmpV family protein [Caballeronia sordidicola]|uniref:Outer membrane protein V n=1 Tax=Caballeronia sordidicola TaxID=196367 RepID=A0A242M5X1_CABSO|nr:MipA/OmpV family protein [Caballeronia sordidicola]OTP66590.1 Outer membrane protein V [Caballeronia sordidicola]